MTAPANKRRTHNDAARAAELRRMPGPAKRVHAPRRSPYGKRLSAMRERTGLRD